jgi:hypothetical protein
MRRRNGHGSQTARKVELEGYDAEDDDEEGWLQPHVEAGLPLQYDSLLGHSLSVYQGLPILKGSYE